LTEALACSGGEGTAGPPPDQEGAVSMATTQSEGCTPSAIRSTRHFELAFALCTNLQDSGLLSRICSRLVSRSTEDPWRACWYANVAVGARARYEHHRRQRRRPDSPLDAADTVPSHPRHLLQLGVGPDEFRQDIIARIPVGLVVVTVTVDEDNDEIVLSRVIHDAPEPLVVRLGQVRATAIATAHHQVAEIVARSDAVIATGSDIIKTEDAQDRAMQMAEWWQKREDLDGELRDSLAAVQKHGFGVASTLFLGQPTSHTYAERLSTEAHALATRLVDAVAGSEALPQVQLELSCERVLDGLVEGVLTLDDADAIAEFLLGGASADPVTEGRAVIAGIVSTVQALRELPGATAGAAASGGGRAAADTQASEKVRPLSATASAQRPAGLKKAFGRKSRGSAPAEPPLTVLHFDPPVAASTTPCAISCIARRPLCIILDKSVQTVPFESMPVMRHHAVCREPSMSLLPARALRNSSTIQDESSFFVLNPSGDLASTQDRFESDFRKRDGWDGTVGEPPAPDRFRAELASRDLFVYCGHGAGQDFFRESALRDVDCKATALLMGCSSGKLRERGDFDPHGIALEYLYAGAPAVVANLWDVTDKDLDGATGHILQVPESCTHFPLARARLLVFPISYSLSCNSPTIELTQQALS
jgi:hypothetical protein